MTDLNASAIAEYSPIEAGLAELRSKYAGVIFDVSTWTGLEQAKAARAEIRKPRYEIERVRKDLKAPALAYAKRIDEEAKRITAEIVKIEEPIDASIKAEEDRREKEKEAKAAAELKRVQDIQASIAQMKDLVIAHANSPATEIDRAWNGLTDLAIDADTFMEFTEQAQDAKDWTLGMLNELYKQASNRESEAARVAAEKAELERQRAELEAQRQAQENERLQREASERAERDRQQAELRAQQEKIRQQQEELNLQRQAQEAAERRVREQQEAEARRQAEAKAQAEREADMARRTKELEERQAAERKARGAQSVDVTDLINTVSRHYSIDAEDAERWIISAARTLTMAVAA